MPTSALTKTIPNFDRLRGGATGLVQNLLEGLPSSAPTQRANAYFGAKSGMPGSDFVRNRGFDLYGEEAEKYKQRGFDDFLKLLQGFDGTVGPTIGQKIQDRQFGEQLDFQKQQAANQLNLDQLQLNLKQPQPLENSYSEFNTLGQRTKFRGAPYTWR